jgi:hypothetical protein
VAASCYVLWGEANVGVIASQAIVDVSYRSQALLLLKKNIPPTKVKKKYGKPTQTPGRRDGPNTDVSLLS